MISKAKKKVKTKAKRKNPSTNLDKLVGENVIIMTKYIACSGILRKTTVETYYIRESNRSIFTQVDFKPSDVTKIKSGSKEIWLDWAGGWAD